MSLIAKLEISTPIMRETAQAVPDMVFQTEDLHITEEAKFVFWAFGDNFERFETALQSDRTVADFALLTELNGCGLYRVTLTDEGREAMTYPDATKLDIVFLKVTATADGWQMRVRAPTREALKAYQDVCREREIPFRLHRLYREEPDGEPDHFGLTPAQWNILERAHECGYFDEPRGITLEELAEEFDVSGSALARRLRRAEDALIEQLLQERA